MTKNIINIEEEDLLNSYINFAEDDSTIYVQYKHRHLSLFSFSFFKEYKKTKYDFNKLHHKNDIELVFDNKKVLYREKKINASNECIKNKKNEPSVGSDSSLMAEQEIWCANLTIVIYNQGLYLKYNLDLSK
ncbi:MAG: hypothetical protein J1F31_06265 [Erysipelotrichales bacterium]|nr:hypothetical protein [Erysipelotrichales bacterium]